ncbi:hypothetical protein [Roseateles sp.]|uniref:hypothetical protein n=1 Tax=Roseateles sp. TaxID=1971397 RepID=UPI0039EC6DB0
MRCTPPVAVQILPRPAVQAVVALIAAFAAADQRRRGPASMAASPLHHVLGGWLADPGRDDEAPVQLAPPIDLDALRLLGISSASQRLRPSRARPPAWGALRATPFATPCGATQR